MKTNVVYRIIESAIKGRKDQCLGYCSKLYDYIEKDQNDPDRDKFLDICRGYFEPESVAWSTQDKNIK